MSLRLCLVQDVCGHFATGDNRPHNHQVRVTIPCQRWMAMDCEKLPLLAELQEFTTGQIFACNIEKIRKIKRELNGN